MLDCIFRGQADRKFEKSFISLRRAVVEMGLRFVPQVPSPQGTAEIKISPIDSSQKHDKPQITGKLKKLVGKMENAQDWEIRDVC